MVAYRPAADSSVPRLFARGILRYQIAMTLRKIARLGQPVLLTEAAPVGDVAAPELQSLIDDMLETMADAEGIGLAAPQVHAGLRIVVALEMPDRSQRGAAKAHVLVNPELTSLGEEIELAFEGCLSIPDLRGVVPRHRRVAYRALDRRGMRVAGEAEGLFARVLQHEVDHLDGILYPMRMTDLRQLAFTTEVPHLTRWLERRGDAT
jgi:peptide deformylase